MKVYDPIPEDYYRDDWKQRSACKGDDRFIQEPNEELGGWLAWICTDCPVFDQCEAQTDVIGFVAGGWRE